MSNVSQLDLSVFKKALSSLEKAVVIYQSQLSNDLIRDATIQRFEYTYELSHKMLKRYLSITEPNAEAIDQLTFPNLIRTASERGLLLHGWEKWSEYRAARNLTSHVYDEKKAMQVCEIIPAFLEEARYLFSALEQRLATS